MDNINISPIYPPWPPPVDLLSTVMVLSDINTVPVDLVANKHCWCSCCCCCSVAAFLIDFSHDRSTHLLLTFFSAAQNCFSVCCFKQQLLQFPVKMFSQDTLNISIIDCWFYSSPPILLRKSYFSFSSSSFSFCHHHPPSDVTDLFPLWKQ